MKPVKQVLVWCALLAKRLCKNVAFIVLFCLIPLTVFAYSFSAQNADGILTIALATEASPDAFSEGLMDELMEDSTLVHFVKAHSTEEAERMVLTQKADAAWIFPNQAEERIYAFAGGDYDQAIVRVVVREQSVPILLANEKLSGVLFTHMARFCYLQNMRHNTAVDLLTDEQILSYFDHALASEQLFSYSYLSTLEAQPTENAEHYLLSPLRGYLAIFLVICGLITAMYFSTDEQNGLFSRIPMEHRMAVEFGYLLVGLFPIALVVYVSLVISGLAVLPARELVVLLLYVLLCAAFAVLVRTWCRKLGFIGAFIALISLLMLAVCPVFFDLPALKIVQLLLPATYFVNAAYFNTYLLYMLGFILVCHGFSAIGRMGWKQ